jgi:hypothetical protein
MRLGCSSRFRSLSRNESDSRPLGSIAGTGLTPRRPHPPPSSPAEGGPNGQERVAPSPPTRPPPHEREGREWERWVRHPRPYPHPTPFRGPGEGKSVKRKRDLFPGSRTAYQGSPWCCHQLNAPWTTVDHRQPPHQGPKGPPRTRLKAPGNPPSPQQGDWQRRRRSGIRSTLPAPEY